MGTDMFMKLMDKNGNVLINDMYDLRNSEWFDGLQGRGWDDEYEELPFVYGLPEFATEKDKALEADKTNGYYGFSNINVADYMKWYNTYCPQKKAGWVNTYDSWRMKNKHWIPYEDLPHYKPGKDEDGVDDGDEYEFVSYIDPRDPNTAMLNKIEEYRKQFSLPVDVIKDWYLVYYFG